MTIKFIPLGSPVSSSLSISSSMALTASIIPTSASLAAHALNLIGPTGDNAITTSSRPLILA